MATETPFDPARYLTRVNGSEYLEVKWRLVWLRDRHPDATVASELVSHTESPPRALFRATISIPGGGSATDYGSETAGDFRDYIEKASTKAIGRALAALGFGTQFCPDHDFGAAIGRVVDSPVGPRQNANTPVQTTANGNRAHTPSSGPGSNEAATQRQLRYLQAVAREAGLDGAGLDERSMAEFGVVAAALTRRDASTLIDLLQTGAPAPVSPSPQPNGLREQVKNGRNAPSPSGRDAAPPTNAPTAKQWEFLDRLVREIDETRETLDEIAAARYGAPLDGLDKRQLSEIIDGVKAVRDGTQTIEALYPASATAGRGGAEREQAATDAPNPWDDEPLGEPPF